jgi:hypothetical protein
MHRVSGLHMQQRRTIGKALGSRRMAGTPPPRWTSWWTPRRMAVTTPLYRSTMAVKHTLLRLGAPRSPLVVRCLLFVSGNVAVYCRCVLFFVVLVALHGLGSVPSCVGFRCFTFVRACVLILLSGGQIEEQTDGRPHADSEVPSNPDSVSYLPGAHVSWSPGTAPVADDIVNLVLGTCCVVLGACFSFVSFHELHRSTGCP